MRKATDLPEPLGPTNIIPALTCWHLNNYIIFVMKSLLQTRYYFSATASTCFLKSISSTGFRSAPGNISKSKELKIGISAWINFGTTASIIAPIIAYVSNAVSFTVPSRSSSSYKIDPAEFKTALTARRPQS